MHLKIKQKFFLPHPCFRFTIVALCLLISSISKGQDNSSFDIAITDCKTKEPIDHVNITNDAGMLLTQTNESGKASINANNNEVLHLSKLGYEKQDMQWHQHKENICLKAKENTLQEVTIDNKKIDLYAYLLELRNKNYPSFLDRDSLLNYAFHYSSTSLATGRMIDTASGNFAVTYKDHYSYPLKFLNFKGAQITNFSYQCDSLRFIKDDFKKIKYVNLFELMCMYNLMSEQMDFQWKRISPKEIKLERLVDNGKVFTVSERGKLFEKFYFDATDKIEKIEFYRPSVFFKDNYDEKDCSFKCTVIYSKDYPRMATSFEEIYEVKNPSLPYKVSFLIQLNNAPSPPTIVSAKSGKFDYDIILSGAGTFRRIWEMIEEGKQEKYVTELK